MGSLLNGLVRLQAVENRLRAAKAKLVRCKRSVVIQENKIKTEESGLNAKKQEIKLTRMQCDRLELELKTRDQEIAKFRAALNTAKTNKEYATLLTQLNTTKADNSKIETQVLELMKEVEADEAECNALQAAIDGQRQQLEQIRRDSEAAAVKLQAEADQIQAEWNEVSKSIPRKVLEIFERVAETYDGQAVVEIEEREAKPTGYSCGGCYMGITTESVNLLLTRDEIIRCPNCTRILVLGNSMSPR
jgi:predicted  nucleic acid-binding Zn-ribbon protein